MLQRNMSPILKDEVFNYFSMIQEEGSRKGSARHSAPPSPQAPPSPLSAVGGQESGSTYQFLLASPSLSHLLLLQRGLPTVMIHVRKRLLWHRFGAALGCCWPPRRRKVTTFAVVSLVSWHGVGKDEMEQRVCCGKKLKCDPAAQIGKDNMNFSILAMKSVKIGSNMQIKCHIPQAGNWVTLYLPTRNQLALKADKVLLLHK